MPEIKRDFTGLLMARLQEKLNFMQIIVGPRQVGKTTGVKQIFDKWKESKVMASADLPSPPTSEWIIQHWNEAQSKPGNVLLILDEIQKIPRWSETIKSLFDSVRKEKRMKIVLLGSASLEMGTGMNESLAGRYEKIYVPHWDYLESKEAFGWDFETFMQFGGYPAPAELISEPLRWQQFIRDSIIETTLSRDIFGLTDIRKPALFRQAFEIAMNYPAQEISYQKIVGQLQDTGNVTTIRNYLEIMEQAFLLRLIPKYSKNIIREKSSTPKIVPLCPALVNGLVNPERIKEDPIWKGRVLELLVGQHLVLNYNKVSYWRKRNAEVDFIVEAEKKIYAIEVKSSRPRKKDGMREFLKEYPRAIPIIITPENIIKLFSKKLLTEL